MNMLAFSIKNLARYKRRTLITSAVLAFGGTHIGARTRTSYTRRTLITSAALAFGSAALAFTSAAFGGTHIGARTSYTRRTLITSAALVFCILGYIVMEDTKQQ